ncbi:MAG TPA: ATP-binding protein, partial [Burkholderiaceae bacterium]|nr:ATP-binding protein [Burkholderiaceae bacterium]
EFYECELRMRHRDGSWVWVLSCGRVSAWTADGKPEWMHGTNQDITRIKRAQQQLAESQSLLDRTGQVAGVGGWQYDLRTKTLEWTNQTRRLIEVGPEYVPRIEAALSLHPPQARAQVEAALHEATQHGRAFDLELPFVTMAGHHRWVRVVGEGEREPGDPHGPVVRLIGAFQDVTEHHLADAALREAKRLAERANAAKSEFLANMSHEIRTPLNAVIGMAYWLEQSSLNAEQHDAVAKINLAGRTLLGVINDVLDLAKIEAGQIDLEIRDFDLAEVLQELRVLFEPQTKSKGLRLTVNAPKALPYALKGDVTRLRQILSNLIANAIKFTERGEVVVDVETHPIDDEHTHVRFDVRDTGIGISKESQARLFMAFSQADATTTRRFGGTGLGLSIVRRLAHLMHGETGVQSELGQGSVFWVTLNLGNGARLSPRSHVHPAFRMATGNVSALARQPLLTGVRVLIVDDSDINLDVARRILETHGALVTTRGNGLEAVELLKSGEHAFDVVLMDVQMPVMDGLEATRRIRQDLGLARLPVLALTAGALIGERERALKACMNDFITKPIDPQALIRTLQRYVQPEACELSDAGQDTSHGTWPEIDGIESQAVAHRLGDDVELFKSLLKRLIAESADLEDEHATLSAAQASPNEFAARMHRLRGTAGTLSITAVHALASEIEIGLNSASLEGEQLVDRVRCLAHALAALRRASENALLGETVGTAPLNASIESNAFDEQRIEDFARMLERQDLGARMEFKRIEPRLRERLIADDFKRLSTAIDDLRFGDAAKVLAQCLFK